MHDQLLASPALLNDWSCPAGGAALSDVAHELLHLFQDQVPSQLAQPTHPTQKQALAVRGGPDAGWQCKAASAVIVLCEVLYGCSCAGRLGAPSQQPIPAPLSGLHQQQPQHAKPHEHNPCTRQQTSTIQHHTTQHNTPQQHPTQSQETACQPQQQVHHVRIFDHQLPQIVYNNAELEQLIAKALEEFSSAGVWSLPTHQDTDLQNTVLTPQASCLSNKRYISAAGKRRDSSLQPQCHCLVTAASMSWHLYCHTFMYYHYGANEHTAGFSTEPRAYAPGHHRVELHMYSSIQIQLAKPWLRGNSFFPVTQEVTPRRACCRYWVRMQC